MSYLYIAIGIYFLVWTITATIIECCHDKDKDLYLTMHFLGMIWPAVIITYIFFAPLWIAKFIRSKIK